MKILTKKQCNEILMRLCANEIIQNECLRLTDIEAETKATENRSNIAFIVGGRKGAEKIVDTLLERSFKRKEVRK